MPKDPDGLTEITTRATEAGAEIVAAVLRERGIDAQVVGGYLTGFRAEIPAYSTVLVRRRDVEAAKTILAEVRAESVDLDWAEVDVGSPETPEPTPRSRFGRAGATRAMVLASCALTVLLIAAFVPDLWQYPLAVMLTMAFFLLTSGLTLWLSREAIGPADRPAGAPDNGSVPDAR